MKPCTSQRRCRKGIASGIDTKREGARDGKSMSHGIRPIWRRWLRFVACHVLPPSQNVRRVRISQKSKFTNFDQIFRKKYIYLQY
jgi:hypothetical protein